MGTGLDFRRIDLHTHTPASACFHDKGVTPRDFVKAAIKACMDCIAVTDHNTGAWIDKIKKAAEGTKLIVLPGVEIAVQGGVHIVGLFDIDKGTKHIVYLLSRLGIPPDKEGKQEALCKKSAFDVLQEIVDCDGLAILAHIDKPKGAWEDLSGQTRIQLFNDARYCAVETADGSLPQKFRSGAAIRRTPASFQASDNPDPADLRRHSIKGIGSQFTYFKLDDVISLEGLRQCFSDPEVRIRSSGWQDQDGYPRILGLSVTGGFLQNQTAVFNRGLNTIIGGKGAGKSLIVEFLRYALDQPSGDGDILNDHNLKLKFCLGPEETVEVAIQTAQGTPYLIRRTYEGEYTCVEQDSGEKYEGSTRDLFPILAYSQSEVISIARNASAQLELIDRFVDKARHLAAIAEVNGLLDDNDTLLADAMAAQVQLDELKSDLATLNAQIKEKQKALRGDAKDAKVFDQYQRMETKNLALQAQRDYGATLDAILDSALKKVDQAPPPSLPPGQSTDKDLTWSIKRSGDTREAVVAALNTAMTATRKHRSDLSDRIAAWLPQFEAKEKEYYSAHEKAGEKKRLESDRHRLVEEREKLASNMRALRTRADDARELKTQRRALLDRLSNARSDFYAARKAVFDTLTARAGGKLNLNIEHAADRRSFETRLVELLRGTGMRTSDLYSISQQLMPRQFVKLVLARDREALTALGGISVSSASKIIDLFWSQQSLEPLFSLEHSCFPEDKPSILFRKDGGVYAPLDQLSVGQKCTALLIIALAAGEWPIIIDQPEDALDIKTVWEDVSQKLRANKTNRQFILTTHNNTVAVSSDTDMMIHVEASASCASLVCLGGIESAKPLAIQVLEGGEEPYQLRIDKYNLRK